EDRWMRNIVGNVIETDVGPVSSRPSEYMLWNEIYSPALSKELDSLLKKAAAKCVKDPDSLKRIAFMRREFYDRIEKGRANYLKTTADVEAWKGYIPQLEAGEKISVDGKGNEKAWSKAPAHYLLPNSSVKSEAVEVHTFFKALRDRDNFYFYVECEEPETAKMSSLKRKFDEFNIWEDNTVEIFLNPSGDRKTGYQLIFNSLNSLADNRFKLKTMDWKWNSGAEYKTVVTPGKKWTLEVRIPRNTMEPCKDRLVANVMRSRVIGEKRSPFDTWSPKISSSQFVDNYGILEFERAENISILPGGNFTEAVHARRFIGNHRPHRWYNNRIVKKDTRIFRSGGMSVRMDKDTEGLTFYDLRGVMKPATSYRLTFYIKTQDVVSLFTWGGGVYFSLDCGMKPRKTIGFPVNNGKFLGTMPWTRQSFEFTTPEGFGKDGRPYLSFCRHNRYNDPKGIAWIDQVEIFELPAKK
ncbi:MAG: carbohydrate-binding family 9-like protein, partial [Lentisphaeria bacterium]|nr:carbohydrate-binding family 9-like protein [Lentisphaeria bacterium]